MSQIIPTQAIPNQTLNVVVNQQNCTINLWTRGINNYMYMDLFLNNEPIILGRKLTLTGVLPYKYMQAFFNGNFALLNIDGNIITNPDYTLFGTMQQLIYYTDSDLNV